MRAKQPIQGTTNSTQRQKGSALVLAVFVVFLLSAMGVALLFLSVNELKMNKASLNAKKAFYLAESGLEDGRTLLYNLNGSDSLVDELTTAAGPNNVIDFDPTQLVVSYDADGRITGVSGFGDDVPLVPLTQLGEGYYAAFLTNDAVEGIGTWDQDVNNRVMITGIGASNERSMEIVQGIVEIEKIFPSYPPATITMLGPNPGFLGAKSTPKVYDGEDCGGNGIPGLYVPVLGVIGSNADDSIEQAITQNPVYTSGSNSGTDTFADLTDANELTVQTGQGTIDPVWTDCEQLKEMVELVRAVADVVCTDPSCVWPAPASDRVIFVDGDWDIGPSDPPGQGLLLVTGHLQMHGTANWNGLVYTIGQGLFTRYGSGNGTISGATMVADIAGPDNVYGTADDCTGGDNGFAPVVYDERGGGNSDTTYCTSDFLDLDLVRPYDVKQFRQR
jgi:hypothetical protein